MSRGQTSTPAVPSSEIARLLPSRHGARRPQVFGAWFGDRLGGRHGYLWPEAQSCRPASRLPQR